MVSELCLGTMTFGRELDEEGSKELMDAFLAAGGNFIDTADVYEAGVSEEITGRALKDVPRDSYVLATKVRFPMGEGPNDAGLSRKHVLSACDASLSRLGLDHIDLYQVHCWDRLTPIEETLEALDDLVGAGKVRYVGVSNFAAWQVMKALSISEARGLARFVSLQPQYSLVERSIEYELVPLCREEGLGILPWGPLGGGFLSGKYRRDERPPEGSRIAGAPDHYEEAWERRATERNWRVLDEIGRIHEETGKSYAQISLNWLLRQDTVAVPIIGARRLDQLQDNLGATGWSLDEDQTRRLTEASAPPDLYPYRFIEQMQRG